MGITGERTRLSTRGQVVIPKGIRELAQLAAGDEFEVRYDGEKVLLLPLGGYPSKRGVDGELVHETTTESYAGTGFANKWAQRIRALGRLKRLQAEVEGAAIDVSKLVADSRAELDGRFDDDENE